jgi:tetratricopeptide (TPR) repeat protein/mono/diheme cytochrome c family protein
VRCFSADRRLLISPVANMRRAAAALAGLAAVAALHSPAALQGAQDRAPVTFSKDVAPILFDHCASCHRPGQIAPFSVLDYASVRPYARQIAEATARRTMPPWLPEPGYGEFRGAHRLPDAQIELITRWVRDGARGGDPADLPPAPQAAAGWQLGQPDLILTIPEPYQLRAAGGDIFRNLVIPVDIASTRYVRGFEFHPGNPRVVHHATVFVDPERTSRRLDAADREPGYDGMLGTGDGAHVPGGQLLGWTPGRSPASLSDAFAWKLEPGTDLVVQMHLMPSRSTEAVRPEIGLFFTREPPADLHRPVRFHLGSRTIDIPAGQLDYTITDDYVLPVDAAVLSVGPHAHYLARELKAYATLPDGRGRQWLLWIKQWDFNWQGVYEYVTPVPLPRGTRITMVYTYDNSGGNRRNPNHPPRRVVYGPRSSDEMADLWLQLLPARDGDRGALVRDDRERAVAASVAEAQQLLRTSPNAEQHNLLGARYLEAGRPADARAQFEEAIRLKPSYANARVNLGILLQTQGRIAEAISQFRAAIAADAGSFEAHLNLGTALTGTPELAEAAEQLQRAVAIDDGSAEAHNNLAVALGSLGRLTDAIAHLERAIEIDPRYADAHSNLGFALAQAGRRAEALAHLQQALRINPDHAGAREHLSQLTGK